jgi:hypothetical protein
LAAYAGSEGKCIDTVSEGGLAVYSDSTISFEVWNLADFVAFTVIDEAVSSIESATPGEEIGISPGGLTKLRIGENGQLSVLKTHSISPMPSLSLASLRCLLTGSNAVQRADAIVRIDLGSSDFDTSRNSVGWFQTWTSETAIPVLLKPFNAALTQGESLICLMGLDPTLDLSKLRDGMVLHLRIGEETELKASVSEPQAYFPEPSLRDTVPGEGRAARKPTGT